MFFNFALRYFQAFAVALTLFSASVLTYADSSAIHSSIEKAQKSSDAIHDQNATSKATYTPDQVAKKATRAIFKVLEKFPKLTEDNIATYNHSIEKIMDPIIDFKTVAKSVMGKYAHRVSEADIDKFTTIFKYSLIGYYGRIISKYNVGTFTLVSVEPPSETQLKNYTHRKRLSVPVNMVVKSGNQTYQLSYSMMKSADGGAWKIRNISIEGFNMGITLRNQFSQAVSDNHNSPETVIKNWKSIMTSKKNSAD